MQYSKELKDSIIRRMLPPSNEAIRHFATGEIMPERMVLQHQEITLSQINGVHRISSSLSLKLQA